MSKLPAAAIGNYYIGVMSGTSLDAIDLVIAQRTASGFKQIAGSATELPAALRSQLLQICTEKQVSLLTLGEIDHLFALTCARAIKQLLKDNHFSAGQICAIGSHGQTIFHCPLGNYPFSQQIGDANLLAAKTGITCVADFRRMDMAYGGQGAPLVPAFHQALFAQSGKNRIILNIGGIANISLLTSTCQVLGYDTGPGNMLLDAWINKTQGKHFDKDSRFARQGKLQPALLTQLLSEPYFNLPAPKSTGRERFNLAWLEAQLEQLHSSLFSDADIQRTLLELTALTISEQIKKQSSGCEVFVCGGGAQNPLLMSRLQSLMPGHQVSDTHALNVDPMFVEAIAFAWLAEQRIFKQRVALKDVTGAEQDAILGGVYLA
jgi:anhydro-N-acetylmuramic acid kinase